LHSAGVIDDALAHETTQSRFWSVFAPKALGAWHLHQVTHHMQLDFFVMVSSCSSVLGLLGQFSYAATRLSNKSVDASRRLRNFYYISNQLVG